jgi:hypothetical protein
MSIRAFRRSWTRPLPSPQLKLLRSEIVPPREHQQFPLRIGQPAFTRDLAEALGQLAIMRSVVPQPVIRSPAVLQC